MASSASGKVAFVTGGASGIGPALATKLVDKGAEVCIADRQAGLAEDLAQRLSSVGGKAHCIELDGRSYPSFERAVARRCSDPGGSTTYSTYSTMPALGSAGRSTPTRSMTGTTSSTCTCVVWCTASKRSIRS